MAEAGNQVMDGCGLFCYEPSESAYAPSEVPLHLEMDRVLGRICDELRNLP
jgi:hypothetical protein